ncbi:MAG: hypothetical protein ACTSXE_02685 [Candidatus Thorarchaeota archaeon]
MRKKTTIRMSLTPAEVEAGLQLIESLPQGSTLNRTFSNCIEQLFRAFLMKGIEVNGITLLSESEAGKALNKRKEIMAPNVGAIPMEEIALIEEKVQKVTKEARMESIREALQADNPPPDFMKQGGGE